MITLLRKHINDFDNWRVVEVEHGFMIVYKSFYGLVIEKNEIGFAELTGGKTDIMITPFSWWQKILIRLLVKRLFKLKAKSKIKNVNG
jgi:hypothetical protein